MNHLSLKWIVTPGKLFFCLVSWNCHFEFVWSLVNVDDVFVNVFVLLCSGCM